LPSRRRGGSRKTKRKHARRIHKKK
jgi:hypothetical protein